MSDNQSRGTRDFTKYDSMETEALEEILRLDAEAPEGQESDMEEILYIMEVLAERKKIITGNTTLESWNSFQQDYLCNGVSPAKKTEKPARPWLRRMIAAAAVIAILITIPLTAKAFSWDSLWNTFAKWAKETFSFVTVDQPEATEPNPDNINNYQSLQEALTATDKDPNIIPTQIPNGYEINDVKVTETPLQRIYMAKYHSGENQFKITVRSYINTDPEKIEIGPDLLEVYEASGIEYYIFDNHEQLRAVWIKDSYECFISGELTVAEIKMMIDSIGKG